MISPVRSLAPRIQPFRRIAARTASTKVAQVISQDDWTLPHIQLGPTHLNRYKQHYNDTLASDIMYMTYSHRLSQRSPKIEPLQPPQTPYEANRPRPPIMRGNRAVRAKPTEVSPDMVPQIESVIIHTMVKEAVGNKNNLLSAIAAFRAISGETPNGGGRKGSSGVQVLTAKKSAAPWKLRAGMPIAVKVELKGEAMYDFIQSLVDFVLPRLRDFSGVPLPPASTPKNSPASLAGINTVPQKIEDGNLQSTYVAIFSMFLLGDPRMQKNPSICLSKLIKIHYSLLHSDLNISNLFPLSIVFLSILDLAFIVL
ncbi:uncharacterized protein L203_100872 [Cryptococcus depauperatus CBS 7841]|uniref:Large ribosomal subunit protein uL5 C-terminal domain-containing protein n=1 Tax=Cryptococcus depauperatus CBS 7841 TaxID=1295531 RepID=A0AAJ8JNZ3_9TREE